MLVLALSPGVLAAQWANCSGTSSPTCTTGSVGAGTSSPGAPLEVYSYGGGGDNTGGGVIISRYVSGGSYRAGAIFNRYSSAEAADGLWFAVSGSTNPYADLSQVRMVIFQNGNVGIGTVQPQYPLSVNGTVQAKEVIVNTGWSDYVFDANHRIAPLSEVATYIAEHHHLPEIPSASEVAEKGISIGEIQAKLLAKIEELTVHMIQDEDRANRLERENQDLRDRMARVEELSAAHVEK